MDGKTRALLRYASKLTESPAFLGEGDFTALKEVGWDDRAIWEMTALASFFNFTGRMEAASGLPPDEIPESAVLAEAGGD